MLYDSKGNKITTQTKKLMGLYPTPNSYGNIGKFRTISHNVADTEEVIKQDDRFELVRLSQALFARMPCLSAASEQKAEWTIGNCFEPIYNGKNKQWGDTVNEWLMNNWYPNCNVKGNAFDFKTTWKVVSQALDKDGDILMLLVQTRKGARIQFVNTHRIKGRESGEVVKGGRFDGYQIADGVIYNDLGTPIGYSILGKTKEEDYIANVQDAYLIYSPKFMDKGRGIPSISSAILTGQSLNEIHDYLQTALKLESMIYLKEFNATGEAPQHRISNNDFSEETFTQTNVVQPPQIEEAFGGIRYFKYGGADLKGFESNRPSGETQEHIRRLEVQLLSAMGWPHQILYSPETVSGAAARGISEVARRTITSRQMLLEKYAKIAISFAIAVEIQSGNLPDNPNEDWFNYFTFTKPAQFTLDSWYERQADINDYKIGAKSLDEIVSKYGGRLTVVNEHKKNEVLNLYKMIDEIKQLHPEYSKEQIHNDIQLLTPNPIAIPQNPIEETNNNGEQPKK